MGSFYSSQGAAKIRAFLATPSIWAAFTAASRVVVVHRATPSRIGTAITPAVVPPLRSASENSAPIFTKAACSSGVSQLSTGREGLNTPAGNYKIIQKDKDHASSLFGDYVDSSGKVVVANIEIKKDPKPPGTHFQGTPMPYFMRIVSGTGLHAGYLPGYPASHGCIRMPEFMAEDFFRSVSVGTPVTITN